MQFANFDYTTLLCRCKFAGCTQSFFTADKLKRHARYSHGDKTKYFKVCRKCKNHQMAPEGCAPAGKSHLRSSCRANCNRSANYPTVSPQCSQPNCSSTFKKRRMLKLHLKEHQVAVEFKYVCKTQSVRTYSLEPFLLSFLCLSFFLCQDV